MIDLLLYKCVMFRGSYFRIDGYFLSIIPLLHTVNESISISAALLGGSEVHACGVLLLNTYLMTLEVSCTLFCFHSPGQTNG